MNPTDYSARFLMNRTQRDALAEQERKARQDASARNWLENRHLSGQHDFCTPDRCEFGAWDFD